MNEIFFEEVTGCVILKWDIIECDKRQKTNSFFCKNVLLYSRIFYFNDTFCFDKFCQFGQQKRKKTNIFQENSGNFCDSGLIVN